MELIKYEDVKHITTREYFSGDEYAIDIFEAKYTKEEGGNKDTPADVFLRIAKELATMEEDDDKSDELINVWFSLMYAGWFRPGGSVITGVGSGRKTSLNNCTTIPLYKDTIESISQCHYDVMKCAAYRQGIGFDMSNLRPRGSRVGNAAEMSTGTIPWMDMISKIGDYVGQLGRKPALLASISVKHPDVEEFITCKDELGQIENANISVQITNDFMDAVKADGDWELYFKVKSNGDEIRKTVKAKELFRKIAEHAHFKAEPGVQYIDLMREGSMIQAIADETGEERYRIIGTNACSEKSLPAYSVCNLLSINMEMFSVDPEQYKKELEEIVPYLVRLSDNVIDYEYKFNLSPIKQQKEMIEELREVGLGITNLHGWLLKQDTAYDSDKAIELTEDFIKNYAHNVFKTSIELGKEKGNAPAFDRLENKKVLMNSTYFRNIINEFFDGDFNKVTHMRNCAHMSIAPAGSLSSTFPSPCISSGIEPVIGAYYWRRTRAVDKGKYTHYFVIPPRLKEYILSKISKKSGDYVAFNKFSGSEQDEDGKVGLFLIDIINKYLPNGFFKPAHEIDFIKKIQLMGKVYKWIDAAVSCTYNLPYSATVDDVENIYMKAYESGIRAVSVYRDGSRQGVLIFEDPVTNIAKFNVKDGQLCKESRPKHISFVCAPKRPEVLPCNIHHCTVKGTPWLVIIGIHEGIPYELFAGEAEDLYIPKSCKEGSIVKKKNRQYSLEVMIRRSEVEYKNLPHVLMNSEQRAMTRLISLSMRHGTPLEFIVDQLKKANGDITDFSAAVSRVLGTYVKQYVYLKMDNKCPSCGENALTRAESCVKCVSCGYSRCG
jgi:ribonucleoside-diphosphate reductase alpha chain